MTFDGLAGSSDTNREDQMSSYTFKHGIHFKDGHVIEPSYSTYTWYKTIKGALRAGERFSRGIDKYYDNVSMHAVVIVDREGNFVTNLAC